MSNLYTLVTQLFYQLSLIFFWPVAIALLVLFTVSLFDLGMLLVEMWRRRGARHTDLILVARKLSADLRHGRALHAGMLNGVAVSPALARFWNRVEQRLAANGLDEYFDVWLEEALQQEEIEVISRLDRSRALIRIGPMLGLAGTIIPLGPALQALLSGDMGGMVSHLVVGFGAVVCGLVQSGIAYFITLVRERWVRVELKEMENLCELLLRNVNANAPAGEEERHYARVSKA